VGGACGDVHWTEGPADRVQCLPLIFVVLIRRNILILFRDSHVTEAVERKQ
jgi:hypothetical protein